MGVDTKIEIPRGKKSIELVLATIGGLIEKKLPVWSDNGLVKYYYEISEFSYGGKKDRLGRLFITLDFENNDFDNRKENRIIWMNELNNEDEKKYYISFGCWGHNEEIAKIIVNHFGGIADFNDCDDIQIDYVNKFLR